MRPHDGVGAVMRSRPGRLTISGQRFRTVWNRFANGDRFGEFGWQRWSAAASRDKYSEPPRTSLEVLHAPGIAGPGATRRIGSRGVRTHPTEPAAGPWTARSLEPQPERPVCHSDRAAGQQDVRGAPRAASSPNSKSRAAFHGGARLGRPGNPLVLEGPSTAWNTAPELLTVSTPLRSVRRGSPEPRALPREHGGPWRCQRDRPPANRGGRPETVP